MIQMLKIKKRKYRVCCTNLFLFKRNSFEFFYEKQNELKNYQIQLQDYRNEINKVLSKVIITVYFV